MTKKAKMNPPRVEKVAELGHWSVYNDGINPSTCFGMGDVNFRFDSKKRTMTVKVNTDNLEPGEELNVSMPFDVLASVLDLAGYELKKKK